ncbi:hydroxymethylbilane synthase [Aquibacillus koreensis]|uniref:Porphobilinogen deaminase n=1 Tax=Aquibacillus koreensis TaxID=279446 RepID=A0A9X3WG78_9BACI|nr:hydroxymethylbilane synthase [Aquibacillus koreensis]MCT2537929.1 hydroxymethylbilane synthase [Aquibacillus koreensis]MDC3419180.1 hydroxymethylbilane synthase [Aquibacillus koreensis]
MRKIVIGSRKSNLALTQTDWVIDQLKKSGAPYEFEVKKIVTKGDKILDVTLSKVGGKGLFVKEIEQAMYDHEIDMAVHSMKDMPAEVAEGLMIGAIPVREDHRDAFISNGNVALKDLPSGAIVGTSSLRRGSQILAVRPDLEIKWIRGNIDTRLKKLKEENYDAIVLAAAGLIRVGWGDDLVTEYLEPEVCVPAVGQGALAIECREDDTELLDVLAKINHDYTIRTVTAERKFLHLLNGGCQVPIGGYAYLDGEEIVLTALVGTPDGKTILKEVVRGTDPEAVGKEAADRLKQQGAQKIVDDAKEELDK